MSGRSPRRRGFTLVELLVTISVLSVIFASLWAFYLESRVASARLEAQVAMERNATLAMERIGRKLRGAASVSAEPDGITVVALDGTRSRFVVEGAKLIEESNGERLPFARMFAAVRATPVAAAEGSLGGFQLDLTLERPLIQERTVRVDRTAFFARRR